jgi:hypothetical protein
MIVAAGALIAKLSQSQLSIDAASLDGLTTHAFALSERIDDSFYS